MCLTKRSEKLLVLCHVYGVRFRGISPHTPAWYRFSMHCLFHAHPPVFLWVLFFAACWAAHMLFFVEFFCSVCSLFSTPLRLSARHGMKLELNAVQS